MVTSACEILVRDLGPLYTCADLGERERVRTPFLYPDGGVIDLYCRRHNTSITVSDLGETTRWLRSNSAGERRSARQCELIEDVRMTHEVEFFRGMLLARTDEAGLAETINRVAQACLRVSDLWFTLRHRGMQATADEVAEWLDARSISYDRGPRLAGRSGKTWSPAFHTRTPQRSALISVLSTGSRSAAGSAVKQSLAMWYDLSNLKVGRDPLHFVSLFDDSADVWSEEDYRLVEDLSDVVRWSELERLENTLREAA